MTDLWLADWVGHNPNSTVPNISLHTVLHTSMLDDWTALPVHVSTVRYYLTVYGSIAVANTLFSFMRAFLFAFGGVTAAKTIHNK